MNYYKISVISKRTGNHIGYLGEYDISSRYEWFSTISSSEERLSLTIFTKHLLLSLPFGRIVSSFSDRFTFKPIKIEL